jgi:adenylylsulfate kinase-like enzyme
VSAAYEEPVSPAMTIDTDTLSAADAAESIVARMRAPHLIDG